MMEEEGGCDYGRGGIWELLCGEDTILHLDHGIYTCDKMSLNCTQKHTKRNECI